MNFRFDAESMELLNSFLDFNVANRISAFTAMRKSYFGELAPIEKLLSVGDQLSLFDSGLGIGLQRDPGRLNNQCRCPQCSNVLKVRRHKSFQFETYEVIYELKRSCDPVKEASKNANAPEITQDIRLRVSRICK